MRHEGRWEMKLRCGLHQNANGGIFYDECNEAVSGNPWQQVIKNCVKVWPRFLNLF